MPASENANANSNRQEMEQLQERHRKLHEKQIQTRTSLEHARAELSKLQKEATEKYGTCELEELREKLAVMKQENEEKRRAYQAELDQIEQQLSEVETNFQASEQAGS